MAGNTNLPVKITKNMKAPKEPGTHYRLMCMTGKNKGTSYYFTKKRVVMGRSDKVDVQILDTKSSREHAELALVGDQYVLSDLGSQNGVIVNDLKVSQHRLTNNDKIIIGQTVYKYNKIEVKESELVTIDEDEELEEFEEEDALETSKSKKKKGKAKKKPNLLVVIIVLCGVLYALPEGQESPANKKRKGIEIGGLKKESIELSNNRSVEITDKDVRNKLKAFIHRGQREYREENYFRAIEQFELALILVPNHGDASFYLKKTRDSLEGYIESIKAKAKQDEDALKYGSAMKQHCSIITFLQDYPEDERYKEAEQQVAILEEKLGYEKGEYKCF